MAICVNLCTPLGIIIPIMEPVGSPDCLVPVDFQYDVGNIVPSRCGVWTLRGVAGRLIEYGPCLFEFFTDLFASLDLISDDIQNAVFRESRNIGVHIEEIKGKQVTGLKVFNLRPVFRITALARV